MSTNPPNQLTDLQRSVLSILKHKGFDTEVRILASHWLNGYRVPGRIDPEHHLHARFAAKIRKANYESNLKDRPDVNPPEETDAARGAEPAAAQVE